MKTVRMLLGTVGLLLLLAVAGVIYLGAYLDRHKGLLERNWRQPGAR